MTSEPDDPDGVILAARRRPTKDRIRSSWHCCCCCCCCLAVVVVVVVAAVAAGGGDDDVDDVGDEMMMNPEVMHPVPPSPWHCAAVPWRVASLCSLTSALPCLLSANNPSFGPEYRLPSASRRLQ